MIETSQDPVSNSARFRIIGRLGGGAGGDVFEAVDGQSNRRIALKTLRETDPQLIRTLKNEFRAVQDIHHPNLVSLGELAEEGGRWFFTMELVDGSDFLTFVAAGAARSIRVALGKPVKRPIYHDERLRSSLRQLVQGLSALHRAGVVHRDVKPSNVLVTREGRVVIVDFGIAVQARNHVEDSEIIGTPAYMAPEHCGEGVTSPASDLYSVGVMLYQALTGVAPFAGTVADMFRLKMTTEPRPPSAHGVVVAPDLDSLCVDLLRLDPKDRPSSAEVLERLGGDVALDAPSSTGDVIFVGRVRERAQLREAFDHAMAGSTEVAFVVGESGVGKTALVRNFIEGLRSQEGVLVLSGRCYERENVAYKAVDAVMDSLASFLARREDAEVRSVLEDDAGLLVRAFPAFAAACNGVAPSENVASPREQRARLFQAVRRVLARVGEAWPLVITIDDLHWADADSISLLSEALREPDGPRLLLVATLRTDTAMRSRTGLVEGSLAEALTARRRITVEKLPREDAAELIRSLTAELAATTLAKEELHEIVAETLGHPLFIDELVRGRARAASPEKRLLLDDVLWERARSLEATQMRVLQLAAVAGAPVPQDLLASAAAVDRTHIPAVVSALCGARLVRTSGAASSLHVEPYHDRIRETVVAHLAQEERKGAHARLALAAEQSDAADPEFLLLHWEGSGNGRRAAEYAEQAAERASSSLAFDRAATLFAKSVELTEKFGASSTRELKLRLAAALTHAGREAEAARVKLEVAGTSRDTTALDLRRQAAAHLLFSGRFEDGLALLRQALHDVRERYPQSPVSLVFWLLVVRTFLALRGTRFTPRETETLSPEALLRVDTLASAASGFALTDTVRGAYFQTKNLLAALALGDRRRAALAMCMEGCFRSSAGAKGREGAAAIVKEARALAESVGTPDVMAFAHAAQGYFHYFLSDWEPAIESLRRAEIVVREQAVGKHWEMGSARIVLYRALTFAGRIGELRSKVPPIVRDARERNDQFNLAAGLASGLFIVALADDELVEARAALDEVTALLSPTSFHLQHYYVLTGRSLLDLVEGKPRESYWRVNDAMPKIRGALLTRVSSFRAHMQELLARAALASAELHPEEREEWRRRARAHLGKLGRLDAAWAPSAYKLLSACEANLQGDRGRAVAALRESVVELDAAGLRLHAALARDRLAALVGGDEATKLRGAVEAYQVEEGVKNPSRLAVAFVPGL